MELEANQLSQRSIIKMASGIIGLLLVVYLHLFLCLRLFHLFLYLHLFRLFLCHHLFLLFHLYLFLFHHRILSFSLRDP